MTAERVRRFLVAGARLADARDPLGREARERLPHSTGLSPEGVNYALENCLEACPEAEALEQICANHAPAPRVHVVLSANVFTAPLRAIALALASSDRVYVRPSRREPVLTELLHQACQGQFEMVDAISPAAGDHVVAYGADETLAKIGEKLPSGVVYHAHGFGYGAALLDAAACDNFDTAQRLALDVALFDQQGCLSPRFGVVSAPLESALRFAKALGTAFDEWQDRLPRGQLDPDTLEANVRYRDSMTVAGECCLTTRAGTVAVMHEPPQFPLPPVGRNLLLLCTSDWRAPLVHNAARLTQLGVAGAFDELPPGLEHVRWSPLGQMQTPPFDGTVDRRGGCNTLPHRRRMRPADPR